MNRIPTSLASLVSPAVIVGLLLAGALIVGGGAGIAQEATPAPAAHPAHIHLGTCDALDPAPQHMLADVAPIPAAEGAIAVESSVTTVDAPLAEIADGGHAINIHESAENIDRYIACGNIGALPSGEDVAIGLGELNGSGYSGIAILRAAGEQTEVTIYLAQGLAGEAAAGTPEAAAESAAGATVDIVDFAYSPDPITISAGESITWTNQDSAPHTATARDRAVLQSGTLNEGESFTQQFDTAGTYEYFCEFHANMSGTVIVE
jgi:plastocyanin